MGETVVGYAGELHPQVLERAGLPARTCAMELDVSALPFDQKLPAPVLSSFPALLQDVALVVDEAVPAESVRAVVEEGAGTSGLLESVELFDVYRSEALGEGKSHLRFPCASVHRIVPSQTMSAPRLAAAVERAGRGLVSERRADKTPLVSYC